MNGSTPRLLARPWGAGGILIASMICFSVLQSRPVLHEILIATFVTVTTPVSLMLLARAALYRDRAENNGSVPLFEAGSENSDDASSSEAQQ